MQIQPLVAYHVYEVLEFLVVLTNSPSINTCNQLTNDHDSAKCSEAKIVLVPYHWYDVTRSEAHNVVCLCEIIE